MVYCVKCGTKNFDDIEFCAKCGAGLYSPSESKHRALGEGENYYLRRVSAINWLSIGLIMMLWSIGSILKEVYGVSIKWLLPMIIIFGAFVVLNALYELTSKH